MTEGKSSVLPMTNVLVQVASQITDSQFAESQIAVSN